MPFTTDNVVTELNREYAKRGISRDISNYLPSDVDPDMFTHPDQNDPILAATGANRPVEQVAQPVIAGAMKAPKDLLPGVPNAPGIIAPGNMDGKGIAFTGDRNNYVPMNIIPAAVQGGVALLPGHRDGQPLDQTQALEQYNQDGRHLGLFDSAEAAGSYRDNMHNNFGFIDDNLDPSFAGSVAASVGAAVAQDNQSPTAEEQAAAEENLRARTAMQ